MLGANSVGTSGRISSGPKGMPENTKSVSDERFACSLLMDHLTRIGDAGFRCDVNTDDPPDLIVTWENGKRWGVEVTRGYQQVKEIGEATVVASERVTAFLRAFANDLAKDTEEKRRLSYILYLEGPGPFSPWNSFLSRRAWKKETKKLLATHIASESCADLRFPGGNLKSQGPGNGWRVMVGGPVDETNVAVRAMVKQAMENKIKKLPRWRADFTRCWLLILNCYPIANEINEMNTVVKRLVLEDAILAGFDGVFWSGYPGRTLAPISFTESLRVEENVALDSRCGHRT